jgi:two-component system, NtrC family, sensor kinase
VSKLRMLRSIGEQAALAVRNAQLHAALQSYAQNLEEMVDVRTRELRTAQAQLIQSEKLAALGQLAAGIAHEVNNPLQPVLNFLEDAIEDIGEGRPVDPEGLRMAESEVQRIKIIVSRLLDFARPTTSEASEVNLPSVVREVLILVRNQLARTKVSARTEIKEAPAVVGSPTQIKQVVLNLILNALEAMPQGGEIGVEIYPERHGVTLAVQDSGIGMDDATLSRIFEPFYSSKSDGTGLGLSVTYGIVQGYGGEIHVESKPSKGSRFCIWLPRSEHARS